MSSFWYMKCCRRASSKALVTYFKENKVEIASAITKPFPFLMSLRDRGFISEQKYKLFQERCENLVPVNRVMYDVLSDLEKMFGQPLLRVMFSPTNLK
uniref:HSR domain-containing protein n=1 Tax=Nannospalax galili TaxID=1026970 RepID=A0A8C6WD06_NANGA